MTTLLGYQSSTWACIGSDSQISDDKRKYISSKGFQKLFINDEYIIGVAGDLRVINILTSSFVPPIPDVKNLDRFMTTAFIRSLKDTFVEECEGEEVGEVMKGNVFSVAVKGALYEIGVEYEILRIQNDSISAAGTGSLVALGALHALIQDSSKDQKADRSYVKLMISKALKIASHYDVHTSPPFHVHFSEA